MMNIHDFKGTPTVYVECWTSKPTISGVAASEIGKQNATVQLSVGGQIITVKVNPVDGSYTWTSPDPIPDGEYSISITTSDAAGNHGKPSLFTMQVDTSAPVAPELINIFDNQGGNTGSFDPGKNTDDKRPTLTGIAEKGSTVFLRDENNNIVGSAVADKTTGKWVIEPTVDLKPGSNNLTLVSEETLKGAQRVGTPSAPFNIVIGADSGVQSWKAVAQDAPPAAVADDMAIQAFTGKQTQFVESLNRIPTLTGTVEKEDIGKSGLEARITIAGQMFRIPIDPITGKFTWTAADPFPDGDYSVSMVIIDAAKSLGKPRLFTLRIDNTAPVAPELLNLYDDQGARTGSFDAGDTIDDKRPALTGIAQEGTRVYLRDAANNIIGSAVADKVTGKWVIVPSVDLKEGVNNLTLIAEETFAGITRQGTPSGSFTVIIDSTAPVNSGIDTVLDNVGSIQDPVMKGGVTDDNTPTLKGKGTPGDIVTIMSDGKPIGTATIGANGEWSFTPGAPLPDDTYRFTTVISNPAGNQSAESTPYIVIVDTIALAPVIDKGVDDANGTIVDGGKTGDTTPTLEGTGEPGSKVTVEYRDGTGAWTTSPVLATVNPDGSWSWTAPVLASGKSWEFRSKIVDVAGNVSPYSKSFKVDIEQQFSSGYEDFEYQRGTIRTTSPGHTFRSGLHVMGYAPDQNVDDYSKHNHSYKDGFSWGFGSLTENIRNNSNLKFTLPSLSNKLSFSLGAVDGWVIIRTYDAAGKIIHDKDFNGNIGIDIKDFFFQSMSGIASFSIQGINEINGMVIDSVRWGEGAGEIFPWESYNYGQVENIIDLNASPSDSGHSEELVREDILLTETAGIQTLKMTGADQTLTLNELGSKLASIDIIDIVGEGDNTLNVSIEDILAYGDSGLFIADGKTQLLVKGNEGDVVNLNDLIDDSNVSEWHASGEVIVGGTAYQVYSNQDTELLVQQGVEVHLV